ncbi:ComF family protein [Heyndrickxia acidicola]|uniref:ComF family protein n=1 Tax=Heyndrickxia acidicola TaxID=209389 RepID=A0ABU6MI69_9BACI|nr:ComF family protein [Heyndrickxia acidicola]MED1204371.1 ComF family protein [Heyndrickxia acidicola]
MAETCLYCAATLPVHQSWTTLFFQSPPKFVCQDCQAKLVPIKGKLCMKCSRPLDKLAPEFIHHDTCSDCIRWEKDKEWQDILEKNISLYEYNDFARELIARFKFRGDYILARLFAADIQKAVKTISYDHVTAIPLSESRLYERGFNQAEALAREAGLKPLDLLTRLHTEKQSKKSRTDRIHLSNVFQIKRDLEISDKTILLIDDIYTTGSTLRHAGKLLKQAGASKIFSLTLARG